MRVIIHSPNQKIDYAKCVMVIGQNETGQFTVLPNHEDFITILNHGDIKIVQSNHIHVIRIVCQSITQYSRDKNICYIVI